MDSNTGDGLSESEQAGTPPVSSIASRLHRFADEMEDLPVLDGRHPDEILGYDDGGHATLG